MAYSYHANRFHAIPQPRKFILRYADGSFVTNPPHYTMPMILTQSDANKFIFAARAMHDDIPEAIDISTFGEIR